MEYNVKSWMLITNKRQNPGQCYIRYIYIHTAYRACSSTPCEGFQRDICVSIGILNSAKGTL